MNINKNIFYKIVDKINNGPKYKYSFLYRNFYSDLILYWSFWYINSLPKDHELYSHNCLLSDSPEEDFENESKLEESEKQELIPIFRAHKNSSDLHIVIFYMYNLNCMLVKIKDETILKDYETPFLNILIDDTELVKKIKKICNKDKTKLNILFYC